MMLMVAVGNCRCGGDDDSEYVVDNDIGRV